MKRSTLFTLWGVMFILCAALGFIPEPENGLKAILILLCVLFFAPPAYLLHTARDRHTAELIRNLSILSLVSTTVVLIVNFASLTLPQWMGNALYGLLIVISSPMACGQYWLLSMFLWACLLMVSLRRLKRKK